MPTASWDLAVAELVYFIPSSIPLFYCIWKYRNAGFAGLTAWLFLFVFILLQVIGNGMIIGAGMNGTPSITAIIITNVGLSPLFIAIADLMHTRLDRSLKSDHAKTRAKYARRAFHVLTLAAIAIYAVGAANSFSGNTSSKWKALWEAGVVLLLVLWISLVALCYVMLSRTSNTGSRALAWALVISVALLGVRIIYQVVATFDSSNAVLNPITGSIALRVVFDFLTSALILLAMITGGVISEVEGESGARNGMPMTSRGLENGTKR